MCCRDEPALDGSNLSLWWALPFTGLLLSIAAVPQLSPHFWHRHCGKIAAGEMMHTALVEYAPF